MGAGRSCGKNRESKLEDHQKAEHSQSLSGLQCSKSSNKGVFFIGGLRKILTNLADTQLTTETVFLSTPGQYLLADSGFPTESNLVPAFKEPPHGQIPHLQHCICILEGRFQLLQVLRITQWVGACVILHNYLLHDKTPSNSADEGHSPSIIPDHLPYRGTNSAGNNLRKKVFQEVLSHLGLNEELIFL
ncbi:hypothetical protein VP01_374g4 [Puccinia sorghi]|uniref:DDE Tnp4 domain-containing protein n=1 Tax=Puccinia sorghi TaxID=27349 RepID=A0A0L6UTU0_9BASI|nr:hypothetical protein VP01_374g4 [Puccinia sorghi]